MTKHVEVSANDTDRLRALHEPMVEQLARMQALAKRARSHTLRTCIAACAAAGADLVEAQQRMISMMEEEGCLTHAQVDAADAALQRFAATFDKLKRVRP
jgi:hypothetical protein